MYLVKLSKKTGLVLIENENDGVLGIKSFKAVIDHPGLGLDCFTAIALAVDHLSKFAHYDSFDRPKLAMEEVTGNRTAWEWNQELIQSALIRYDELQYDIDIVEGKIHKERKIAKVKELQESEAYWARKRNYPKKEDEEGVVFERPSVISSQLRDINKDIAEYNKIVSGKELYDQSPVKNGYSLSRLEQKIDKKGSFYNKVR